MWQVAACFSVPCRFVLLYLNGVREFVSVFLSLSLSVCISLSLKRSCILSSHRVHAPGAVAVHCCFLCYRIIYRRASPTHGKKNSPEMSSDPSSQAPDNASAGDGGEEALALVFYSVSVARADLLDAVDMARLEEEERLQERRERNRAATARDRRNAASLARRVLRQKQQRDADPRPDAVVAAERAEARRLATNIRRQQARARKKRRCSTCSTEARCILSPFFICP